MNTDDIMGAAALAEAITHPLAILVSPSEHPEKFGVVKVRENGTLEEIQEKPEHPATNLYQLVLWFLIPASLTTMHRGIVVENTT